MFTVVIIKNISGCPQRGGESKSPLLYIHYYKLGVVVFNCNPSWSGGRSRRITSSRTSLTVSQK
jgi:hypothetical protein